MVMKFKRIRKASQIPKSYKKSNKEYVKRVIKHMGYADIVVGKPPKKK